MKKGNTDITYENIKLIPASLNDYSIIQNMARFYLYVMTEYMGFEPDWEMPADGLYECADFRVYLEVSDTFPFIIRYHDELVGFAIVDKKGSDNNIEFNMAEFFIVRKFKAKGIGKYVAYQCFSQFKGIWEVMTYPKNQAAYDFWKAVITDYTKNNFSEYTRCVVHLDDTQKDIFKFQS